MNPWAISSILSMLGFLFMRVLPWATAIVALWGLYTSFDVLWSSLILKVNAISYIVTSFPAALAFIAKANRFVPISEILAMISCAMGIRITAMLIRWFKAWMKN